MGSFDFSVLVEYDLCHKTNNEERYTFFLFFQLLERFVRRKSAAISASPCQAMEQLLQSVCAGLVTDYRTTDSVCVSVGIFKLTSRATAMTS